MSVAVFVCVATCATSGNQYAPLVQRTNGVVVPPAGSAPASGPVIPGHFGSADAIRVVEHPLGALAGATRHGSRATFTFRSSPGFQPLAEVSARVCRTLLFPVVAVSRECNIGHMCFDLDSRPPIPPIAGAAVDGQSLELQAADGTRFLAYAADTASPSNAGVLILPDARGLHPFYEELALRFAEAGVDALAMDYFGRTAGTAPRGEDFEFRAHLEQVRYAGMRADMQAAGTDLRRRRGVRNLFTIGFCFGGRLAFVSATHSELDLAGAIGFYGGPVGPGRGGVPAPLDVTSEMRCPVLGLFGGADQGIPVEDVERFRRALTEAGVENELVVYPDAPHSFFDRKADQYAEASADAWRRVLEFVRRITSAP